VALESLHICLTINLRGVLDIVTQYPSNSMSGVSGGSSRVHWNELLTERSRKFYDGTYQWDGVDGYWDEKKRETGN
jgi:hypothetical protein